MSRFFDPPLSASEVEASVRGVTLLEVLGEGGQGMAFKVTHKTAPSPAALKLYGPMTAPARVDREIDKLRRLDCDAVVRLYDHGEAELRGQLCRFALLEYIDGQEGAKVIGRLSRVAINAELNAMLSNIAVGISAMWDLRVVHRDLKPANVIRRSTGQYVILDLGLARHLDESSISVPGGVCGTYGYMSPEQALGRRGLTLRSDFFALGVLAYEIATGSHPFHRRQDLIGKVAARPIRELVPEISVVAAEVIHWCLQPNPLARPPDADSIIKSLARP